MKRFEHGFLLGAATAAHQVEGNNKNSDCWAMEHMEHTSFIEPSLEAVDHYNRYKEDIKLIATTGLNTYRFSIEWARIEPEEGVFDESEIEHYRDVIRTCRKHGIEPMVTLHHFSSPIWIISKGGWEATSIVNDFAKYSKYVIGKLGVDLNYVCTINEANIGLQIAAIGERYRRQMKAQMVKAQDHTTTDQTDGTIPMGINLEKMMANQKAVKEENKEIFGVEQVHNFTSMRSEEGDLLIMKAHEAARKSIKEIAPHIQVGITLSLHDMQVIEEGGEAYAKKEWQDEFDHYLPYIEEDDFLGVQNYTRSLFGAQGPLPYPDDAEITQMNYEFYPEALEKIIRRVSKDFKGDLFVTENGIATADDNRRIAFIETALTGVMNCLQDGIPIKGYYYWSLMDNFEWQKGYVMTFGLIEVERATQKRHPKASMSYLGSWVNKI